MIEVTQVVEHEADQPDLVFDLFYADFLAGEDCAEIDFHPVEAYPPAAGDDGAAGLLLQEVLGSGLGGLVPAVLLGNDGRRIPGLDHRTMRHANYQLSQHKRKLIEQAFGWLKVITGLRKSRFFGRARTELTDGDERL